MNKSYFVYILTDKSDAVLYIGITNDLERRLWEHKQKLVDGFTKKYGCQKLIYFEQTENVFSAMEREKQLKNWHRDWKINLIKQENPKFEDLSADWFEGPETNSG